MKAARNDEPAQALAPAKKWNAQIQLMARSEGIIPALESAHALAWIVREADTLRGATVLMNLSGRGDKDVAQMMEILGR